MVRSLADRTFQPRSNCKTPSRRELVWQELERYIPKEKMLMFGKCGKKGRIGSKQEIGPKVLEKSKFYFSAENSLCHGYISEKFHRAFRAGMIPVAYGGARGRKDYWAANKRFEISKFKFKIPRARTCELHRARSRLYRSQILQVNTRWKALAEIYTMHSFAPFSNINFFVKNC